MNESQKFAVGGLMPAFHTSRPGLASPIKSIQIGSGTSGLIHSSVPGRTDRLSMRVKPNSYVIPADVVSGIGQGNTMAGAKMFDQIFKGPHGSSMPKVGARRASLPRPPRVKLADGGAADPDIIAAGGEYVIDPEIVTAIGGGDVDAGHKRLDEMVKSVRKQIIDQMKKLPGPVR